MTKEQFWILNLVGAALSLTLLFNVYLGYSNRQMAKQIQQSQPNQASVQAFEKVAQNLLLRIANLSRSDKALQDLLTKYKVEVKFQDTTPNP